MASIHSLTLGLAVLLLPAACAGQEKNVIPDHVKTILENATKYEVYSLDPGPGEGVKDGFHRWKVLGKTTVMAETKRATLLEALSKGVADNKGEAAKCFIPRHGLRATHDGKTIDLVICFECMHVYVYADPKDSEKKSDSFFTTGSPEEAFDKVLKDAGVPLAKKK